MENRWPPDSVKSLVTPCAFSRRATSRPPWSLSWVSVVMAGKLVERAHDGADVGLVGGMRCTVREDDLVAGRDDERAAELVPVLLGGAQRQVAQPAQCRGRRAGVEHVARRA